MRYEHCRSCTTPLTARVAHVERDEDGTARVMMTRDEHVWNCHSLPSNEEVIDLWCGECGAKYMVMK